MASKYELCSKALVDLGEDTISSFTDDTSRSRICGLIYPDFIKYLLCLYPWKFNTVKAQLARLSTTPLNEWTYAYQLPSDNLNLIAVYNSSSVGAYPITVFKRAGSTIMTNETSIYIDYQAEVESDNFPYYFAEFAVKAFAAKIAIAITDDQKIAELMHIKAFGNPSDNNNGGEFAVAKRLDSLQNTTSAIPANDLLMARFG